MKSGRNWGRLGMKSNCETIKAEDFCFTVTDGTHDSPKAKEDGHYLITSKHLAPYNIDFSSAKRISDEDYQQVIKRSPVEQWDILFSMIGTIGITYLEKNTNIDYACKNMGIFKFNGDKDKAYWLYYYLQTPQAKEYILGHLRGTTQQYLPLGSLRDFPIQVPSTKIRNNITSILRSLDDRIAVNIAINENLESQAQAIFKSWFVDFEPFGGVMPEDWRTGSLSEICGYSKDKVNIEDLTLDTYYSTENMQPNRQGAVQATTLPTIKQTTACKKGNVLISNIRPYFKKIIYCFADCGCSTDVLCFVPNKSEYSAFLYCALYSDKFFDYMVAGSKGTKMPRGDKQQIMIYPICIPSTEYVEQFSKIVAPMLETVYTNRLEANDLAILRDTLLPKLMNGEIDVSEVKI